jgi:opacity protein-like surface antigen
MKKLALSILVLFVIAFSNAHSQSVYVKIGGGYGRFLAEQNIINSAHWPSWQYNFGSYGRGMNLQAGVGYNFTQNIALEVAGSYTYGVIYEITRSVDNTKYRLYANSIFIMPSLIVKAPMKDITPYARVGMVAGIITKYTESIPYPFTGSVDEGPYDYKEYGGLALGIQCAAGISFIAVKKIDIFAEVFGIGLTYSPKTLENTKNLTGALQPIVTYSESGITGDNNTAPTPSYPFSSIGMNIGLIYTFGK